MPETFRLLVLYGVLAAAAAAYSGDIATLEIRIQSPLTSYQTSAGTVFDSLLIAPCMVGNRILLPMGTRVRGRVKHRTQVGIGFLHERAGLDLEFFEYQLPDGRVFPLTGRLQTVENARETVDRSGHIRGVLAADNPQHWLDGFWNRPSITLFQHSLLGLTGLSGRVFTGFALGPIGGAALIAFRITMFSLPEPEIRFPAGTELKVALTSLPRGAPTFPRAPDASLPGDLESWLQAQSFAISKSNRRPSEDIVNVGLVGTRQQLIDAFHAAGWMQALPRTVRSLSHLWHSYATQTGYADAPASRLLYQGAAPELLFEKSLSTIAMRHHVRLWQTDSVGRQVWLGAATHDVAIRFDTTDRAFSHKIDPRIDFERDKVVNDLGFAGCADPAAYVARPAAKRAVADPRNVSTDGRLAVIALHPCNGPAATADLNFSVPARSIFIRAFRRVILETKQYLLRENLYFWGFRAWQWNHARTQEPAFIDY